MDTPAPPRARFAAAKVCALGWGPARSGQCYHTSVNSQAGVGAGDPKGLRQWASERGYAGPYPSLWPSPDFMWDA